MKLKEIYETVDALAPFVLSKEYMAKGMHDNSGLLLDCGKDINRVLFSLDLSQEAVLQAVNANADLIITHHPAIWEGAMRLTPEDTPALSACIRA